MKVFAALLTFTFKNPKMILKTSKFLHFSKQAGSILVRKCTKIEDIFADN